MRSPLCHKSLVPPAVMIYKGNDINSHFFLEKKPQSVQITAMIKITVNFLGHDMKNVFTKDDKN